MQTPVQIVDPQESTQQFYIAAQSSLSELRPRTLKHGDTFALFDRHGDLSAFAAGPEGLYHEDMRFLSRLRLSIERHPPMLLSSTVQSDNAVLDVDLVNPDLMRGDRVELPKDTIHVSRMKFLWNAACYEIVSVRNYDEQTRRVCIELEFDADFKDIFEVRGFARQSHGSVQAKVAAPHHVQFNYASVDRVARSTEIFFTPRPRDLFPHQASFELELPPKKRRAILMTTHCRVEKAPIERRVLVAARSARKALHDASTRAASLDTSSSVVNEVLCRSMADISMLVTDTEHGAYPYAGVPWFSTPFGRDGLITALQTLWIYPALARGVLRFLADTQATEPDPLSDAEPGKILHETRRGELARLGEVPFARYYGSVDSTPLFVALAGLYWQYTADRDTLAYIWPNIQAALRWIDSHGDIDGDGFLEYRRKADTGLFNQGWKDSGDAVFHADGNIAEPPIALCEVQGYVYLARLMAAHMAEALGETVLAATQRARANQLRDRFNEAFWDDELGMYALALDGEKRRCRVRSSNAGQLLFTGIATPERATRVAHTLAGREFFSGWGIRTISARERRFNPASYHNGSIWPHDNALIALGLAKYGHSTQVTQLTQAILDAAAHLELRRLPELFSGSHRRRSKGPVLYPVACAPQAWAAATPFALLQACLDLQIDASQKIVHLRHPRLPASVDCLCIRNLSVGDARLDLLLRRHGEDVAVNVLRKDGEADVDVRI